MRRLEPPPNGSTSGCSSDTDGVVHGSDVDDTLPFCGVEPMLRRMPKPIRKMTSLDTVVKNTFLEVVFEEAATLGAVRRSRSSA